MHLKKLWTAIDLLSILGKSNLSDKLKQNFSQAASVGILRYGCTIGTLIKYIEKKLDGNYLRMVVAVLNKSWKQQPTKLQLYSLKHSISKQFKEDE